MRNRRARTARRTRVYADVPWWGVSFLVHLIALLVLSHIEMAAPPPKKNRIEIRAEFIQLTERLKPVSRRDVFKQEEGPQQEGKGNPLDRMLKSASNLVPMAALGTVSASTFDDLFNSGQGGGLGGAGWRGGKKVAKVRKELAKNYEEAIDDFAQEMIDVLSDKPVMAVLLFDESQSLQDDRQLIMAKLQSVKKALDDNLDDGERSRLKWAVVSYGRHARIWLRPSPSIDSVIEAIERIKPDPSGEENLVSALRYCVSSFAKVKKATKIVVVITDEAGCDVNRSTYVEDTISALKRSKFRVFFFGREAVFASHEGEEIPQGTDWNRPVPVDKGPESAAIEFFPYDEIFVTSKNVPSGYAMFAQARIAAATSGQCYLLSDKESGYDDRKLEELRPELCSGKEYKQRTQKSSIRRVHMFILKSWPRMTPGLRLGTGGYQSAMQKAAKAIGFCSDAIRQLKKLRGKRKHACKHNPKRWRANYDLMYAQLHKFRYMLRQYCIALQKGGTGFPLTDAEGNKLAALGFQLEAPQEPTKTDKELAQVYELFDEIIKDYQGTPWAAIAEQEKKTTAPMGTQPMYQRPRQRSQGPEPRPPKL